MPDLNIGSAHLPARLKTGCGAAVFVLGIVVSGHALARTGIEVVLASSAQALAFCKAGSLPNGGIAYFNGTGGDAQYAKKCAQAVPMKKVREALRLHGNHVRECELADARHAIALCNNGGMGIYDIAYIAGPAATVIGGPGYGCTTNITTLGIGNAICR